MTPFLFVYGTLLPDANGKLGATERMKLRDAGEFMGPAHMQGILLDLGGYPGLMPGAGPVYGGIYKLHDAAATLKWLDEYEGVTGNRSDEYERLEREAAFQRDPMQSDDQTLSAWTYVFIGSSQGLCKIASGRWHQRLA